MGYVKYMADFSLPRRWVMRFAMWVAKRPRRDNGLCFSIPVLNRLKPKMYKMPLEILSEFADGICIELVRSNDRCIHEAFEDQELFYNHINATAIGNYAFIARYHPDQALRDRALQALEKCFEDALLRLNYD